MDGPRPLIHSCRVEGVLGFGEREQRPFHWPRVSLATRGSMQVQIQFIRQRSNPTLEQTNMISAQMETALHETALRGE